ncbi:hypothetical protein PHISCL_10554 [Aspergillus sclerotialis]|uniref:Uncharacterized protein n=1 Tax=Aspergillus sclerotialis TaxID=2070753 RepID=A0A3A2Z253_9EURO|nr:hypothetical protein PHISCL_10554 [Aspergillus sclerotialis]
MVTILDIPHSPTRLCPPTVPQWSTTKRLPQNVPSPSHQFTPQSPRFLRSLDRKPFAGSETTAWPGVKHGQYHKWRLASVPPRVYQHSTEKQFPRRDRLLPAETANLTRENQMLRMRIRELEKQIGELTTAKAFAKDVFINQ